MHPLRILLAICIFFVGSNVWAASPEGTWKFVRSADYFGEMPVNQAPEFTTLVFGNNEVKLSATCVAQINASPYFFSDVFQLLSKQGISAKQLDFFLLKRFQLSLLTTKVVYGLKSPKDCADPMMDFFVVGDRILMDAGATFYTYAKVQTEVTSLSSTATGGAVDAMVVGYKLSKLPMTFERYNTTCTPKILNAQGKPRTSDQCAPDYFPYVADPKSADPIMKLVGNHDYGKWGQRYTEGFSPPFAQKVPATIMVFAPMKQVILVRVDDFELVRHEEREMMSGVFLSIVDGKVVDQIQGCDMTVDYVCMQRGTPRAKLTVNGKFKPL